MFEIRYQLRKTVFDNVFKYRGEESGNRARLFFGRMS